MIYSMTGFGRGRATVSGTTATVEIKSVNKRHHDVSVRMPGRLAEKEAEIQNRLRDAFERGRFSVYVDVEEAQPDAVPYEVDTAAATQYKELLERLCAATQIQEPIRLDHLLQFDDVFTEAHPDEEEMIAESWAAVEKALDGAIDELRTMRAREGTDLRDELDLRIDAIEEGLETVEARAPERIREHQERLRDRLDEILDDERIDDERLETEIAILADKLDVTEECVRLRSHLTMFREALDDDDPSGRKLKFITQEIHREVNTIGAKANDAEISSAGVRMKEDVEKIREQVENVE